MMPTNVSVLSISSLAQAMFFVFQYRKRLNDSLTSVSFHSMRMESIHHRKAKRRPSQWYG